jgi:PhnB protein
MIIEDSLFAFKTYEKVFKAEKIEATSYEKGLNEVVFTIMDTRFHMLDENKEYGIYAPIKDKTNSMWCNLLVEDIEDIFNKSKEEKFEIIQPLTELEDFGVINAVISDPFGYQWMLHQIVKEVSFEERCKIIEEHMKK